MRCELFAYFERCPAEIRSVKFSASNYCDRQRRSPRITAKRVVQSDLDFLSKVEGAQQELDESELWLELLGDADIVKPALLAPLLQETNELLAIFVTMTKNVKMRRRKA